MKKRKAARATRKSSTASKRRTSESPKRKSSGKAMRKRGEQPEREAAEISMPVTETPASEPSMR